MIESLPDLGVQEPYQVKASARRIDLRRVAGGDRRPERGHGIAQADLGPFDPLDLDNVQPPGVIANDQRAHRAILAPGQHHLGLPTA